MSGRGLSGDMVTELDKLQNKVSHLAEIYFDDETVYTTDLFTSTVWNGHTYVAVGDFGGFDGIEESTDAIIAQPSVTLSGVNQDWIARVLTKEYLNRRIVVRKATYNAAWQVVVDPGVLFDGLMKNPRIVENPDSGSCSVIIECRNDAANFENPSGRRTNDTLHREAFPDDGFFKYANQADRQLVWGEGGAGAAPASTPVASSFDQYQESGVE